MKNLVYNGLFRLAFDADVFRAVHISQFSLSWFTCCLPLLVNACGRSQPRYYPTDS